MLSDKTLQRLCGWSLVLFGIVWTFGVGLTVRDWAAPQISIEPISLIAGIGLILVGLRVSRGRVESANSGIGCMWIVLLLCGLWLLAAMMLYFGLVSEGDGPHVSLKWRGRELKASDIPVATIGVLAIAAWAMANLSMLKKWRQRAAARKARVGADDAASVPTDRPV